MRVYCKSIVLTNDSSYYLTLSRGHAQVEIILLTINAMLSSELSQVHFRS